MEEKYDPVEKRLKNLIRGARIASIVAIVWYLLIVIPIALFMLGFGDGRNPVWSYPVLILYLVSLIIGFKWHGLGALIGGVPLIFLLFSSVTFMDFLPFLVIPNLVLSVPIILNLTVWNMKRKLRKNLQNSQ